MPSLQAFDDLAQVYGNLYLFTYQNSKFFSWQTTVLMEKLKHWIASNSTFRLLFVVNLSTWGVFNSLLVNKDM
jgi:hypothetical protein